MAPVGEDSEDEEDPLLLERQEKELAAQKARIVAESIQESSPQSSRPSSTAAHSHREGERESPIHRPVTSNGSENSARVPLPLPSRSSATTTSSSSAKQTVVALSEKEPPAPASRASSRPISEARIPKSPRVNSAKAGGSFDIVSRNVQLAVDSEAGGLPFVTPRESESSSKEERKREGEGES